MKPKTRAVKACWTERDWYFIRRIQRLEATLGTLINWLHLNPLGTQDTEALIKMLLKALPKKCKPSTPTRKQTRNRS